MDAQGRRDSVGDVGVDVVGRAAKRGIIPRLPAGERLLADVEAWLRAEYPDFVRRVDCGRSADAAATLAVGLHPAAPALRLVADDEGAVSGRAVTSALGAGYHTFVARLLERVGEELSIDWSEASPGGRAADPARTGDAPDGEDADVDPPSVPAEVAAPRDRFAATLRPAAEQAQLGWLGAALHGIRAGANRPGLPAHIGMPAGTLVGWDGAVLVTPLGPRDAAWLDAAVGDPRVAIDVCPWWADATDARYLLGRALCLLWTEVRWRPPATDDERAVDEETVGLMRRAFPLDPALPYPWREWHELLELLGPRGVIAPRDAMARQVAERAASAGDAEPIGYRRADVTIVHEGWALDVPGSWAERRTDEEWWGGEGGRRITLAATETGDERGPMRAEAFLGQVASDLGGEAIRHEDGAVVGRARLREETSSGMSVGVLEGFSAVTGRGAAVRIEFDDPGDWSWAVDQWRSLRPF